MHRRNHMLRSNSFRAQDIHIHEDSFAQCPAPLRENANASLAVNCRKEKERTAQAI